MKTSVSLLHACFVIHAQFLIVFVKFVSGRMNSARSSVKGDLSCRCRSDVPDTFRSVRAPAGCTHGNLSYRYIHFNRMHTALAALTAYAYVYL